MVALTVSTAYSAEWGKRTLPTVAVETFSAWEQLRDHPGAVGGWWHPRTTHGAVWFGTLDAAREAATEIRR